VPIGKPYFSFIPERKFSFEEWRKGRRIFWLYIFLYILLILYFIYVGLPYHYRHNSNYAYYFKLFFKFIQIIYVFAFYIVGYISIVSDINRVICLCSNCISKLSYVVCVILCYVLPYFFIKNMSYFTVRYSFAFFVLTVFLFFSYIFFTEYIFGKEQTPEDLIKKRDKAEEIKKILDYHR